MEPLKRFKFVAGTHYGTPKEVWGFRTKLGRGEPSFQAREFLKANEDLLGLRKIPLRRRRVIESLGARHIIFRQYLDDLPIHRGYVTVHSSRSGQAYLVKNRSVPLELAHGAAPFELDAKTAERRARESVSRNPELVHVQPAERMWFPLGSKLRPAYRVHVRKLRPREDWVIFVDGETARILRKYDNLANRAAVAKVFDPNPVVALGSDRQLLHNGRPTAPPESAYSTVRLYGLRAGGHLDGPRVTTRLTRRRVRRRDGQFVFTSKDRAFEEVMAYFHIDRSVRYLESLGFRGDRAIFRKPIPVDANGTQDDNSWYSPHDRSLTFGLGGVDDAEDAEIILHELGHAIQDAICPGFGQSLDAAAMGEGFGDYFAASFFADVKKPRYRTSVGVWDGIQDTENDPPCVRRVDEHVTYEVFDHSDDADEHVNGEIWSATLWEIRNALKGRISDRIILESHFQLDGFTTFARGARAIMDADRNLYHGRHIPQLRTIFHRKGIGPVD